MYFSPSIILGDIFYAYESRALANSNKPPTHKG